MMTATPRLIVSIAAALALAAISLHAQRSAATPPTPFSVVEKSIIELKNAMETKRVTSRQIVEQYLERIKAYDQAGPAINAFITINPRALQVADTLDRERRAGKVRGPLHGIPIVIKDNYATADMPTTAGSLALEGFQTGRDAFMVKKLRDAGAIMIGKTNLHELAYGITSISSMGGQTKNPYDLTRNPGGSSGGTGAAVAANFAAAGMGTDTCGSIRNPSSENNLFGLRGTLGLSSRDGIVPLSHTQDIGGPLARTVTDLILMLDATVGFDPGDPLTANSKGHIPKTYLSGVGDSSLQDVHIGMLTANFGNALQDAEVADIVRRAIERLRSIGARVSEVTIPGFDELLQGSSVLNAEFKFDLLDFLAKYPKAPVHSLSEILDKGLYSSAIDGNLRRSEAVEARETEAYRASLGKREIARQRIVAAMVSQGITALAYPTLRRKPALIGEAQAGSNCQLSPTTGLPAISVPAGFTTDGLPVGMDLLGGEFSEQTLLRIAFSYEREVHPRRPPSATP